MHPNNSPESKLLLINIFERNPKLFIDLISLYYPLDEVLINLSKKKLTKNVLILNQNIEWTISLFKKNDLARYVTDTKHPPIPWEILFDDNYFISNADFENLSSFKHIPWTIELIDKHKEEWTWNIDDDVYLYGETNCLLNNPSLPWSIELIEKFNDKWDWHYLSHCKFIPWSIELIEKFKDKLYFSHLSQNEYIPWSYELIKRFKNRWDWDSLLQNNNVPISDEISNLFFKNSTMYGSDWDDFKDSKNRTPPLNDDDIYALASYFLYEEEWNLKINGKSIWQCGWLISEDEDMVKVDYDAFRKIIGKTWSEISQNEIIPWTNDLIETFKDKWNWTFLSKNTSIPLTIEFIEEFEYNWDWGILGRNKNLPLEIIQEYKYVLHRGKDYHNSLYQNKYIPWTLELIEKYDLYLDKKALSGNETISWTKELIAKLKEKIHWDILSSNQSLPWSIVLIEEYENKWDWKSLSKNKSISWSIELLKKYDNKWDWDSICKNESITKIWSVKLINKYAEKIRCSESIWKTLQPYIDDEMLEDIFDTNHNTSKNNPKVISKDELKTKQQVKIPAKVILRTTLKEKIKEAIADPRVKAGTLFIAGITKEKDKNGIHQIMMEVVQKIQLNTREDKFKTNPIALYVWIKITAPGFDSLFKNIGITGKEIQEKSVTLTKEQSLMLFARVKTILVDDEEEVPAISIKQYSAENGLPNRIQKILDLEESERSEDQNTELKKYAMRTNEGEPLVDDFGNQVYQLNELTYGDADHIFIKKMPLSEYISRHIN